MLCKLLSITDMTTFYTKEDILVSLSTKTLLALFTENPSTAGFSRQLYALGRNGHEKTAFLYLLIELHQYNLILNKSIYDSESVRIKEFDAIDIAGLELFEDKQKFGRESLEKIFGSKHTNRTAHTQVLGNAEVCAKNNIPRLKTLTITYSIIEQTLSQYSLGQMLGNLPYKHTLLLTIPETITILKPLLFKTAYANYLQNSGLETIQFIRIPINYRESVACS